MLRLFFAYYSEGTFCKTGRTRVTRNPALPFPCLHSLQPFLEQLRGCSFETAAGFLFTQQRTGDGSTSGVKLSPLRAVGKVQCVTNSQCWGKDLQGHLRTSCRAHLLIPLRKGMLGVWTNSTEEGETQWISPFVHSSRCKLFGLGKEEPI